MEAVANQKFGLGKIKARRLYFEVCAFTYLLEDAMEFIFYISRAYRRLTIENFKEFRNVLMMQGDPIKVVFGQNEFFLMSSRTYRSRLDITLTSLEHF